MKSPVNDDRNRDCFAGPRNDDRSSRTEIKLSKRLKSWAKMVNQQSYSTPPKSLPKL